MYGSGLWEEAGVSGETTCRHRENKVTPKIPGTSGIRPCCEAAALTVLPMQVNSRTSCFTHAVLQNVKDACAANLCRSHVTLLASWFGTQASGSPPNNVCTTGASPGAFIAVCTEFVLNSFPQTSLTQQKPSLNWSKQQLVRIEVQEKHLHTC